MPNNCNETHANLLNTDKLRERLLKSRMHRKVWSCLSQGVCWDFAVEQFISGNRSLPYLVGFTLSGRNLQFPRILCWKSVHHSVKEIKKKIHWRHSGYFETRLDIFRVRSHASYSHSLLLQSLTWSSKSMSAGGEGQHYDSGDITWYMPIGWYSGTSTEGSGLKMCPTTHSNVFRLRLSFWSRATIMSARRGSTSKPLELNQSLCSLTRSCLECSIVFFCTQTEWLPPPSTLFISWTSGQGIKNQENSSQTAAHQNCSHAVMHQNISLERLAQNW